MFELYSTPTGMAVCAETQCARRNDLRKIDTQPGHFSIGAEVSVGQFGGHIKNIHLHSCKHKTVTLKLALILTMTLTDTGGAVLTLMLGYRRLRIYKLKREIRN